MIKYNHKNIHQFILNYGELSLVEYPEDIKKLKNIEEMKQINHFYKV